jgi:hypothetical protein
VIGPALRRIVWVLSAYALGAWLVLQGAAWLQRVLALPRIFHTLLLGGLLVGIPVAALVAWRYPELGVAHLADPAGGGGDSGVPD